MEGDVGYHAGYTHIALILFASHFRMANVILYAD